MMENLFQRKFVFRFQSFAAAMFFLLSFHEYATLQAQSNIHQRIDQCQRSGGANGCIYNLLRELAARTETSHSDPRPTILYDTESFGYDLSEVIAFQSDLSQCMQTCSAYGPQCKGVVLTPQSTCHLKNSIPQTNLTYKNGYTTVIIRQ